MGFDLDAKNKRAGEDGYFRATIYAMYLFRCAMRQTGVSQKVIHAKFFGNGGQLVTAKQVATVGEKLQEWLKGKHLTPSRRRP